MDWQDIETAPKPGVDDPPEHILLSWTNLKEDGTPSYHVGEGYWHPGGGAANEGDWWWANCCPGDYYNSPIGESISGRVVAWMPLPPPPQ